MFLNDDIVDIDIPDRICLLTFVADEFSGLFLHPSIFSIKHAKSADNKLFFIRFLILIKI